MSLLDRRGFLLKTAKYTGGALVAPSLAGLVACNADDATAPHIATRADRAARKGQGGYGPLVAHPSLPFLVPEGFTLVQLSRAGDAFAGGTPGTVPNALDGMGAFWNIPGKPHHIRLVRNHEIRDPAAIARPIGATPYDAKAGGGTTTLELEVDRDGVPHLLREHVSLSGTHVNCAGGVTPWGSWLTGEETTEGPAQGRLQPHGYLFEVPALADGEVAAEPIRAMGRFSHEAVAVDIGLGHLYMTEDSGNTSGFYRYLPESRRELQNGGRLQMLAVEGLPQLDTTRGGIPALTPMKATWVDIEDPDPAVITATTSCFAQGLAKGGTRFARLEGCWWGDHSVFFNATSGGAIGAGQVWQYRPQGPDGGYLILVFESPSRDLLDAPDNICVSPSGGLVLCEDGGGTQFLRGLTQDGRIFDLVRAANPADATEFAGACFGPQGDILFFNTQGSTTSAGTERGGTFALRGPWKEGALG